MPYSASSSSSGYTLTQPRTGQTGTVPNTKSAPGVNDWSSYRMALPMTAYTSNMAGYASGSSRYNVADYVPLARSSFPRPYDIYRLTAHVNVDLLNFLHSNEESFEARLMAGGYVGYGSSLGARMVPNTTAMHLPTASYTSHHVSQPSVPPKPPLDERTTRKARRLAAFESGALPRSAKLRPVEVEGRGRMLLDFSEETATSHDSAPGNSQNTPADLNRDGAGATLPWPDEQFPWNLRNHERIQQARLERERQLRCIERFLDFASDEEEEEESDAAIFREAGYYVVKTDHSSKANVEPASNACCNAAVLDVLTPSRATRSHPL